MEFKNKKVLVMGLGTLGGGVATTRWFVKHGAMVTVTDLRDAAALKSAVKALGKISKKVKFVLGRHDERDFKENDVVSVNPAVPRESKFLDIAKKAGKTLTNDAQIFFNEVKNPVIAITGTRGKTTTANWTAHFLGSGGMMGGNTPEAPLLYLLDKAKNKKTVVVELSSWQLELLPGARRAPDVALITNLYPDHLNRYKSIRDYALAKSNIFASQNANQALILNADSQWTGFFLGQKPKSRIYFFSLKPLPKNQNGIFIRSGRIYFGENKKYEVVLLADKLRDFYKRGEHSVQNLLSAMLVAHLAGLSWTKIRPKISSLPDVSFREEIVTNRKNLLVVNDSAATSPDATIAAVKRFGTPHTFLISGGTDKKLEFKEFATAIKKYIKPANLFLLNGSATQKLVQSLKKIHYAGEFKIYEDLEGILKDIKTAVAAYRKAVVLFSPGAASFEKFKNEFDRGMRFNLLVSKILKS
ncbi:MAG TPA: UDP-N-acetylmuramoyl-L-alanine--D-glutamate ligase [Candidatus Paceibacterota bacterium]